MYRTSVAQRPFNRPPNTFRLGVDRVQLIEEHKRVVSPTLPLGSRKTSLTRRVVVSRTWESCVPIFNLHSFCSVSNLFTMQVAEAEEELRVCRADLQKADARLRAITQELTGVQKEVLAPSTDP